MKTNLKIKLKIKKRNAITVGILSLLLTFMQIAGWQLSMDYGSSVHQSTFFQNIGVLSTSQCIIWGIIEFAIFFTLLYLLFDKLEKRENALANAPTETSTDTGIFRRIGLYSFVAMFLIWMIFLWGCYPGYYNYDIGNQLPQFLYPEVPYNSHHPLLHTLLLGSIISLGYRIYTIDLTFGVFLYNAFQMAVCTVCLSYSLHYIYKQTRNRVLTVLTFCFYAICPPIVMFAMCPTKDVLCFSFLSVAIIRLMELTSKLDRAETTKVSDWIIPGVFLALSCLLRNNIVYALVVFVPFSLLVLRKNRLKQLLLYIGIIILCVAVNKTLLIALDAIPTSLNEALCVPYQQIARVYTEKGSDAFTDEELELLSRAIPLNSLHSNDPVMGDPIKANFNPGLETIKASKLDYLMLWLQKGLDYPGIYIEAFLYKTYQAWYPGTILMDQNGPRYFDITGWQDEYGTPHWQGLFDFYKAIRFGEYANFPILRLFFSIGTMFWVMLIAWFYAILRKDKTMILPMLLVLLVCATNFCGPVSDLRYYLMLFYLMPVCVGSMIRKKTM